jgi:hypothetical protein
MPKNSRPPSDNYRKPPVEFQFKPGQSGHPAGRPPKRKPPEVSALGGGIADRLIAMVLEEMIRPVTVREGEKAMELPALQAVVRTMVRAAAKGNAKIGGQLLPLMTRAESGRAAAALQDLQQAVRYTERNRALLEKYEDEGADPPEIYPHPDDFIFDENTGEYKIDGPLTRDQAGARKAVRELALEKLGRYFEVETALKKTPRDRKLKREFKELKKYYDFLEADSERNTRHEALRIARRTLEPENPEPEGKEPKEPGRDKSDEA